MKLKEEANSLVNDNVKKSAELYEAALLVLRNASFNEAAQTAHEKLKLTHGCGAARCDKCQMSKELVSAFQVHELAAKIYTNLSLT